MDLVQGYHQIALDKESSELTTFLLPGGRYRFKRTPMGLSASGDLFCNATDTALNGIDGLQKLVDDILLMAPDEPTLFKKIRTVLDRCRKHGITISLKKLMIGSSVPFAGFIVSDKGVQPDPERLRSIRDFPTPKNTTELRSFLGMANQLGSFIPDLAHATSNIRGLLRKSICFRLVERAPRRIRQSQIDSHINTHRGLFRSNATN